MKEQIEAVQRMQDYIESHWQESITLADLSKALYTYGGDEERSGVVRKMIIMKRETMYVK